MIDLTKFTKERLVTMPIVDCWGKYGGRRVCVNVEDGWYQIELGNNVEVKRKATQLQIHLALREQPLIRCYALGNEGITTNFDAWKRMGMQESAPIHFLNLGVFKVAKARVWDDARLYYDEEDARFQRDTLREVQKAFNGEGILSDVRGVTPEIRYYLVLCNLQRSAARALTDLKSFSISESELARRVKSFEYSVEDRIRLAVTEAGGNFISCSPKGNYILVEWEVGGQTLKSHVRDDLRIISAGFCLSGADKEHSLNSIVNLAKLFQEDRPLYITRE